MNEQQLEEILKTLAGLKFHEWKTIESAVNMEFSAMSNRLELTDVSKIQRNIVNEIIHCQSESCIPSITR